MKKFFDCYKCGVKNRMGDESCRNCGAPFQYNCPSCGFPIKAGEPQCPKCKNALTWPFADEEQAGAEGKSREKRGSWLMPLIGLVVLIVIVGAGISVLMQSSQKPAQPILPVDNSSQPVVIPTTAADTVPPLISNIAVDNLSYNSVEISWMTDKPSTSQVLWNPKGEYASPTPVKEALVTQHTVDLPDLKTKTIYYFKVKSVDQNRNEAVSEQKIFGIGVDLGQTQVIVFSHSMSVQDIPSTGTTTYIKGEIRNTGNLPVLAKDIEVPILITVAGRPASEILATLDAPTTEMNPGDSIKFSAIVPNDTDPGYLVSVRITGQ
jgi:hypothetical protein